MRSEGSHSLPVGKGKYRSRFCPLYSVNDPSLWDSIVYIQVENSVYLCLKWRLNIAGSLMTRKISDFAQTTWSSKRRTMTKVQMLLSLLKGKTKKKFIGGDMEQRLEEWPSRVCPTWGSSPYTCSQQIQTILMKPRSACWQKPDRAVSWEALPALDKYWGEC